MQCFSDEPIQLAGYQIFADYEEQFIKPLEIPRTIQKLSDLFQSAYFTRHNLLKFILHLQDIEPEEVPIVIELVENFKLDDELLNQLDGPLYRIEIDGT